MWLLAIAGNLSQRVNRCRHHMPAAIELNVNVNTVDIKDRTTLTTAYHHAITLNESVCHIGPSIDGGVECESMVRLGLVPADCKCCLAHQHPSFPPRPALNPLRIVTDRDSTL